MKSAKLVTLLALALCLGMILSLTSFTSGAFAQSATHAATTPVTSGASPAAQVSVAAPMPQNSMDPHYSWMAHHHAMAAPRVNVKIKRLTINASRYNADESFNHSIINASRYNANKSFNHSTINAPQYNVNTNINRLNVDIDRYNLKIDRLTVNLTININNPNLSYGLNLKNLTFPKSISGLLP